MGVTYGMHLIEPAAFDRVVDELRRLDPTAITRLRETVRAKSEFPDVSVEQFDELLAAEEGLDKAANRQALLLTLAPERKWHLDKSLDCGLDAVFRAVPELAALRRIADRGRY